MEADAPLREHWPSSKPRCAAGFSIYCWPIEIKIDKDEISIYAEAEGFGPSKP